MQAEQTDLRADRHRHLELDILVASRLNIVATSEPNFDEEAHALTA